jgi:hypothetical protein
MSEIAYGTQPSATYTFRVRLSGGATGRDVAGTALDGAETAV